jgi:hypothetical protein
MLLIHTLSSQTRCDVDIATFCIFYGNLLNLANMAYPILHVEMIAQLQLILFSMGASYFKLPSSHEVGERTDAGRHIAITGVRVIAVRAVSVTEQKAER